VISQAMQDYLKTIYKLQKERADVGVVSNSLVAESMQIAAPSATNMIKKLAEIHLVQHTPYRGVTLTEAGEKIALEIIRHHRLLELYLTEALGYSWDEVDAEAEKLEHVISEEFEDRIDEILGFPTVDPHGAPIPSRKGDIHHRTSLPLSQLQAGQVAIVQEVSDQNPELLRYVEDLGLKLGTRMEVRDRAPFNGPLLLTINADKQYSMGLEVASQIFVTIVE
jgi:DtxR family Mn-dependent transcriptional regulator